MTDPSKRPPKNPFLDRIEKRATGSHGKSYEKKSAPSLAAMLTPASGALAGAKGDAIKKRGDKQGFLIEMKTTDGLSLSVKLEWLVKITEEALAKGMEPAVLLAFVTPEGRARPRCESEWVMVPKHVWQELTDD